MIYAIISLVAAYLIGSINSSILISKMVTGKDIRESGSGNAGATNMLRTMGKKYAVITLVIDILKGVIAVLLARLASDMSGISWIVYASGALVCIGHCYPLFFGFKGGKGVATGLGVLLMWDWQTGLIVLAVAIALMALTRYVSLGSVTAAFLFAVIEIVKLKGSIIESVCVVAVALLLIWKHRANIMRLIHGNENKLGAKKEANS